MLDAIKAGMLNTYQSNATGPPAVRMRNEYVLPLIVTPMMPMYLEPSWVRRASCGIAADGSDRVSVYSPNATSEFALLVCAVPDE